VTIDRRRLALNVLLRAAALVPRYHFHGLQKEDVTMACDRLGTRVGLGERGWEGGGMRRSPEALWKIGRPSGRFCKTQFWCKNDSGRSTRTAAWRVEEMNVHRRPHTAWLGDNNSVGDAILPQVLENIGRPRLVVAGCGGYAQAVFGKCAAACVGKCSA